MSEGLLSWSTLNSPLNQGWRMARNLTGTYTGKASQIRFPSTYRGFVSGPSYARKISDGAHPTGATMAELFSNSATGDTGHEYYKRKIVRFEANHSLWNHSTAAPHYAPWVITAAQLGYTPSWKPGDTWWMSDADLANESVGFLAGTVPLRSEADLMQAVLEVLREGLPSSLFRSITRLRSPSKLKLLRASAGDYLNYAFGITPLIQEIDKVYRAVATINDLVEQWIRDSGIDVVRRRGTPSSLTVKSLGKFSGSVSNVISGRSYRVADPASSLYKTQGHEVVLWSVDPPGSPTASISDVLSVSQRFGFSASYNYDLNRLAIPGLAPGISNLSSIELRSYLAAYALGISPDNINASLVWELVPFSWLVDWFVNVGQVLDVSTSLQQAGLHVNFAYLTSIENLKWTQEFTIDNWSPYGTVVGRNVIEAFAMRRIRATPFGFGTDFSSLSAFQVSILAALAANKGIRG